MAQQETMLARSGRPQTTFRKSQSYGKRVFRYVLLFALFFGLLYLRRSAQLLHPQVWDEDGTMILPGLIDHGLKSLFYPVNGYLILLPKLISAISLLVSGLYYPLVSTLISWIFIVYVCITIAVSPTWLKGGALLGIATLLIPSDPEVFGIPLYSFWWASLLLFLLVLWDQNSNDVGRRIVFAVLGGLSSPMILLVTPFLAIRAVVFKDKRRELVVFAVALFCCCIQMVAMLHSAGQLTAGTMGTRSLLYVLPKFVGGYLAGNFVRTTNHLVWIATGFIFVFLLIVFPFIRKHPQYLYLIALWCGAIYLTGRRVDLSILQPRYAGPRYFFLPFVLLSWFLVSTMTETQRWDIRLFAAGLLLVSVLNMLPVRTRPQQDFHWAEQLSSCGRSDQYWIPISFDGERPWFLHVNRDQCMALQHAGLINLDSRLP
jgi:hypothetical protein